VGGAIVAGLPATTVFYLHPLRLPLPCAAYCCCCCRWAVLNTWLRISLSGCAGLYSRTTTADVTAATCAVLRAGNEISLLGLRAAAAFYYSRRCSAFPSGRAGADTRYRWKDLRGARLPALEYLRLPRASINRHSSRGGGGRTTYLRASGMPVRATAFLGAVVLRFEPAGVWEGTGGLARPGT